MDTYNRSIIGLKSRSNGEYFEKMIPARFPNGKSLNYNIRSFFGNGEFPIISTLVLIYKDSIYWAYGISR